MKTFKCTLELRRNNEIAFRVLEQPDEWRDPDKRFYASNGVVIDACLYPNIIGRYIDLRGRERRADNNIAIVRWLSAGPHKSFAMYRDALWEFCAAAALAMGNGSMAPISEKRPIDEIRRYRALERRGLVWIAGGVIGITEFGSIANLAYRAAGRANLLRNCL